MTAPDHKPTIPEVIERFEAYHEKPGNESWGALHLVLADGNTEDVFVTGALELAESTGDIEGAELALVLLQMSRTQRRKLPQVISQRRK